MSTAVVLRGGREDGGIVKVGPGQDRLFLTVADSAKPRFTVEAQDVHIHTYVVNLEARVADLQECERCGERWRQ